jgi:hypothetical protein
MSPERLRVAVRVLHATAYYEPLSEDDVFLLQSWVRPEDENSAPSNLAYLVIDAELPPSRMLPGKERSSGIRRSATA